MRCSHSRYPRISKPRTSALKDGPLRALPTEMATDWLTTWNGSSAPIRPIPITDGDGLLDGWEVYGVNGIDLRAKHASPPHKDIFVEMDYMRRQTAANGLAPNNAVLKRIALIYANSPLSNPDGRDGIDIHLELGNEVPYDEDLKPSRRRIQQAQTSEFRSQARTRLPLHDLGQRL